VKATAPLFDRFDPIYNLGRPGGVFNEHFISQWRDGNATRDAGQRCPEGQQFNPQCLLLKLLVGPLKPVDSDRGGDELAGILAGRDNDFDVYTAVKSVTYREDELAPSLTAAEISPFGLRQEIESGGVPMYIQMSWFDAASVNGTLSRYLTFSNPQQVVIGPWSHGGGDHTDPFFDPETPTDPSEAEQVQAVIEFFDRYLKGDGAAPIESSITYYTLGAGTWQTTSTWPPAGGETQTWHFAEGGMLVSVPPTGQGGADAYAVDFTASTGEDSRWHTPLGGDVIYPDRREEDQKLLTYTSGPLTADLQITGNPVVNLYVSSTATDGAFFVYLEDVAPDGTVTYITEGILQA
jgi:putative CocE/NonD family hydrolase